MPQAIDSISTTAVDRYLARCEHGDGMIFDVVVFFNGELDVERLASAWQDTIRENPQLYFRFAGRGKDQVWQHTSFAADKFAVPNALKSSDQPLPAGIDVRQGVGARMTVLPGPRVKFSFHHAACDGVGVARVIYQTMRRYRDGVRSSPNAVESPSDSESMSATKASKIPNLQNLLATIRGQNARLDRHSIDQQDVAGTQISLPMVQIDRQRSGLIRKRLRNRKIPINDFAVTIALHALATITRPANRRYISILNPVQTRSWNQRYSTRNHIGFAFVRRRHDQLTSVRDTLDSVTEQMNYVRSAGVAGELAAGIQIAENIPGGLALIDRLGWFTPTASVTCLSSLKFGKRTGFSPKSAAKSPAEPEHRAQTYQVGEAIVKGIQISGPLQYGGQLSITMWDTGDGLSFSLRGRPNHRSGAVEFATAKKIEQVVDTFLSETAP
jgi:hypothetical protein